MERDRRHTIAIGECSYAYDNRTSQSLPPSSFPSPGFIEHKVSKFDTLAGVAIKYGVEVADIKKMNGLATDLQMFALRTLQIPLPGRHPPSPCLSDDPEPPGQNSSSRSPNHHNPCDLFDSFQSFRLKTTPARVSPAMNSLQGYYGLKPMEDKATSEGFGMDGPYFKPYPSSTPPLNRHRKSKSLANGFFDENGELLNNIYVGESGDGSPDRVNEKLFRRRQKSEADFTIHPPETVLKVDNNSTGAFSPSSGAFSPASGKGLALRSKSRTSLATDTESNLPPGVGGDAVVIDMFSAVRKSSSTSSLQDQESSSSSSLSSMWPTSKRSLKSDLQALSAATIAKPFFDGLPPITGKRNKTALD